MKQGLAVLTLSLASASLPTLEGSDLFSQGGSLPVVKNLSGLSLPDRTPEEQSGPQATEAAINTFKDAISKIYSANGKKETQLRESIEELRSALKKLCITLDGQFDAVAFDKAEMNKCYLMANSVLKKNGYLLEDFSVQASKEDGGEGIVSISLQKVLRKRQVEIAGADFGFAGASKNPFTKPIELFDTITEIKEVPKIKVLAPLTCMTFDTEFERTGIVIPHDRLKRFLPNSDPSHFEKLDPDVDTFLKNYGTGRFIFQVSSDRGDNIFPQVFMMGKTPAFIRNAVGLHYALKLNSEPGDGVAGLLLSMLSVDKESRESVFLSTLSSAAAAKVSEEFPELRDIKTSKDVQSILENNPGAGAKFIKTLDELLSRELLKIKEGYEKAKELQQQLRDQKNTI